MERKRGRDGKRAEGKGGARQEEGGREGEERARESGGKDGGRKGCAVQGEWESKGGCKGGRVKGREGDREKEEGQNGDAGTRFMWIPATVTSLTLFSRVIFSRLVPPREKERVCVVGLANLLVCNAIEAHALPAQRDC